MDLIGLICSGAGNKFGGIVCEYYIRLTRDCDLLSQNNLEVIFKTGRCNPKKFLTDTIRRNLNKYKDIIDNEKHFSKHLSSIAFTLSKRLNEKRLTQGSNLATLIGYIRKASYTEVILFLENEGFLEKKTCGNCVFLSELKPYICHREEIEVTNDGVTELKNNPFYLIERKRIDKCKKGFKSRIFISMDKDEDSDSTDKFNFQLSNRMTNVSTNNADSRIDIEKITEILKKRAINTKHKNTKKLYKRQYEVLINLYRVLSEGYSIREALQLTAEKIGKNVKTIERDFDDIRTFLNREISYN
jgi:hypothetical protein